MAMMKKIFLLFLLVGLFLPSLLYALPTAEEIGSNMAQLRLVDLEEQAQEASAKSAEVFANMPERERIAFGSEGMDVALAYIDSLGKQSIAITQFLSTEMEPFMATFRVLTLMTEDNKENPVLLRAILSQNMLLVESMENRLAPILKLQNYLRNLQTNLETAVRNIQETGGEEILIRNLMQLVGKVMVLQKKLQDDIQPLFSLMERAKEYNTYIEKISREAWRGYYFSAPAKIFNPYAWANEKQYWDIMVEDLPFRLDVELPSAEYMGSTFFIYFINTICLAVLFMFVARKWIKRLDPQNAFIGLRRYTQKGFFLLALGIAVFLGVFDLIGPQYRLMLVLSSLLIISGEICLTWALSCLHNKVKNPGPNPFRPILLASCGAIVISYPNFPLLVLTLVWTGFLVLNLILTRKALKRDMLTAERTFLRLHIIAVWLSIFLSLFGWPLLSLVLQLGVDCILVSAHIIVTLLAFFNQNLRKYNTDQLSSQALWSTIFAALAVPAAIALVFGGIVMWIIAMPAGYIISVEYLRLRLQVASISLELNSIIIVVCLYYIMRATILALCMFAKHSIHKVEGIDKSIVSPLCAGITYTLWAVFILLIMYYLGFSMENAAFIAGGLSVGIGFGLQAVVGNFIAGLILIFSRVMNEGDIVDVGDLRGTVKKISIRATSLETTDNALIYVPNSEFISSKFINWTRNGVTVRKEIEVGVAYDVDLELAASLLIKAAHSLEHELAKHQKPFTRLVDIHTWEFKLSLFYFVDMHKASDVSGKLREKIVELFKQYGIPIASLSVDVRANKPASPQNNAAKDEALPKALPQAQPALMPDED